MGIMTLREENVMVTFGGKMGILNLLNPITGAKLEI